MRPFEIIAQAEQAWHDGDLEQAEKLFRQGISAYKSEEADGADFALGRCGAFFLAQERRDEAARVLEEAIERNTDIPAIWADYLRIIADRHDLGAFKRSAERMAASAGFEIDFLLSHARRADRDGATVFAEQVARWVVERCSQDGNTTGRWAAIGDLGRILERSGDPDQAVKLWRDAFKEGSCDSETINRLSMYLERAKDYVGAALVIREALTRRLSANVEEGLRKRLIRCEQKRAGGSTVKTKKPVDIPAYSVRMESDLFEPVFQVRPRHSFSTIAVVNNRARCLFSFRESSTLVDFEVTSGAEVRKIENLPLMGSVWFTPEGHGIGVHRTAAVGQGPTLLRFLSVEGRVTSESSVPDATSEIALGPDLWYVGCRNGFLYGFGFDGRQRWAWETPGATTYADNAYFRPCPYYVASRQSFAAVSSMGNIYAVSANGKTLWHSALPNERQTRWSFTIPAQDTKENKEPYDVLGIPSRAPLEKVKSAYRRLALATHPDRNPDDNEASANFRRVQEAYERILAGQNGESTDGITLSIEMQGGGPSASFIASNDTSVVVGSSQGRLYMFSAEGTLREARVLGDSPVHAAFRSDGTLGAAWCSNALLVFRRDQIVNAAESLDWPRALTMLQDDIVLWRRNEVQVMNPNGRLMFSLEFSKSVTDVVASGHMLLCAGGVLAAFRRRSG
jgi:tetratricopeptide (TPR) repeat protein